MAGRVRTSRDHVAAVAVRLNSFFFVVNNRSICSLTFLSSILFAFFLSLFTKPTYFRVYTDDVKLTKALQVF